MFLPLLENLTNTVAHHTLPHWCIFPVGVYHSVIVFTSGFTQYVVDTQ